MNTSLWRPEDGRSSTAERIGRFACHAGIFLAAAAITGRALYPSEDADSGSGLELLLLELGCGVCWSCARWYHGRSAPTSFAVRSWCVLLVWLWITSLAAVYRFPAVILAWEWTGVGLVFLFLSQVAGGGVRRAIAALLMGLVIGQSLLAWWQVTVTFPELRRMYRRHDPTLVKAMQDELGVAPDSPEAISLQSRLLHSTEPYGTFGLPNSLAGFLLLGLPAVAVAVWKCRAGRPARLAVFAALMLVASALVLTKSRSAWLAIAASGAAAFLASGVRQHPVFQDTATSLRRRTFAWLRRHLLLLAALLLLLTTLVVALAAAGLLDRLVLTETFKSLSYRGEWWRASLGIIAERPLMGVGLGNFGDHYLRHKLPFSSEEIRDPHNFLLELWCTAGFPALATYLAALVGALGACWLAVTNGKDTEQAESVGDSTAKAHWLHGERGASAPCFQGQEATAKAHGLHTVGSAGKKLAGPLSENRLLSRWSLGGAAAGLALVALAKLGLGEAIAQGELSAIFAFGSWATLVCFAIGMPIGGFLAGMLPDRSLPAVLATGAVALHVNWLAAGSTSYPALLLPCWAALASGSPTATDGRRTTWLDDLVSLLTIGLLGCFLWTLLLPVLGREQIHRQLRSIKEPASERLLEGYRAAALRLPMDQDGWLRLALLHFARMRLAEIADPRREYAHAVAALQRALALAPQRSSTYQLLGRLHAHAAERELDPAARKQASAAFERVVELYPHSAARRWELATALLAEGATERAGNEFRQALWLDQTPHLDKRLTPTQRSIAKLYAGK